MSKVSIEREELVKLREFMQGATPYSPDWNAAMSMMNDMLGKGEDHSVCAGCLVDGNCSSQIRVGRDKVHGCTLRVPATPPAPKVGYSDGSALGPRGHTDPGDENLLVDGRLPPQYVTRQEMEAAIADALKAHEKKKHVVAEGVTSRDGYQVMMRPIAERAVDDALKAHEEKRHGVGQPSHDDCAHFIVCGLPKPCAGVCGFYQKPLKS